MSRFTLFVVPFLSFRSGAQEPYFPCYPSHSQHFLWNSSQKSVTLSDLFRLADEHPPDGGVILFNLKLSRSLLAVFSVGALSGAALAQYSSQPSTNLPSHMPTETRRPVSIS